MKKEDKHMDNLILTGWGWKEYAASAAVTLRALNGLADVMGMSKRRLPEFLELWRRGATCVGVEVPQANQGDVGERSPHERRTGALDRAAARCA